jgi:hypothetical protein
VRVLTGHFIDGEQEGEEVLTGAGVFEVGAFAEQVALVDGDFVIAFPVGDGGEAGLFHSHGIEQPVSEKLAATILDVRGKQPPVLAHNQIWTQPHDAYRNRASLSMASSSMGFSTA